jgi:hypothetical protein
MKYLQIAATVLGFLFACYAVHAVDLPPREKIEKDGWTIEFSPIDRVVAEQLAGQTAKFEQIRAEAKTAKIELEPSVIEARAEELAKKLAELCALPNRAGDFQKEIKRMLPTVVELQSELLKAVSPRAVSIVRKSELIQRLQGGEKIPLFSYDAATNLVNFYFNFQFRFDKNYVITEHPERLTAIPLKQSEDEKPVEDPAASLLKDFQDKTGHFSSMAGQMYGRMGVAIGYNLVIANVLSDEVRSGSSAQWIKSGASQWALRRMFVHALNPELAESYLWYHEQLLQMAYKNPKAINLEESPEKLNIDQQAAAYAVFRTIAEKHGNEAVTKLLAAFWKLSLEKRTSDAFKKIIQKQLKQPLSAYLPHGVVAEPVADKTTK